MTTKEFEVFLQKAIDPTINIRPHPQNTDIVGIYWGDVYTDTAIPSGEILPERTASYTDNFGYPHRGSIEAEERVRGFIERFNTDEDFRNDVLGVDDEDSSTK